MKLTTDKASYLRCTTACCCPTVSVQDETIWPLFLLLALLIFGIVALAGTLVSLADKRRERLWYRDRRSRLDKVKENK